MKILRYLWRRWLRMQRACGVLALFYQDAREYLAHYGERHMDCKEAMLARIIMSYHMVEKGLTMPRRRLGFGQGVVSELIGHVYEFEARFGRCQQLDVAIGVLRNYYQVNKTALRNTDLCKALSAFDNQYADVAAVDQMHFTRDDYFAKNGAAFPEFAASRHTVRHFCGEVSDGEIARAVELAMTAPSACNRQHVRVHCVGSHVQRDAIFALQGGNRGFGSDADKILLITTDLHDVRWAAERHDSYTNAGLFLMNLCYALHYYKIVCCILNWSVYHDTDTALRKLVDIPPQEVVVAILACGKAPERFEVARSTRKPLGDILTFCS